MVSIKEMAVQVHANACAKGWWGKKDPNDVVKPTRDKFDSLYGLILTEVAEATECVRDGQHATVVRADGKPEGFPSEVADIAIRIFDVAEAYRFDIESSVVAYMMDGPYINHSVIRTMSEEGLLNVSLNEAVKFYTGLEPIELSEKNAIEAGAMLYRISKALCKQENTHRPDNALTECLLGVFVLCVRFGIDLEKEILQKHEYNKQRSFKHGGKAL